MNAAMWFAAAVAVVAAILFDASCRQRRWLEAGISAGSFTVCIILAVAVSQPTIPVWLLLMAVWVVVVLAGLAGWSLLRAREKARTGEETR